MDERVIAAIIGVAGLLLGTLLTHVLNGRSRKKDMKSIVEIINKNLGSYSEDDKNIKQCLASIESDAPHSLKEISSVIGSFSNPRADTIKFLIDDMVERIEKMGNLNDCQKELLDERTHKLVELENKHKELKWGYSKLKQDYDELQEGYDKSRPFVFRLDKMEQMAKDFEELQKQNIELTRENRTIKRLLKRKAITIRSR